MRRKLLSFAVPAMVGAVVASSAFAYASRERTDHVVPLAGQPHKCVANRASSLQRLSLTDLEAFNAARNSCACSLIQAKKIAASYDDLSSNEQYYLVGSVAEIEFVEMSSAEAADAQNQYISSLVSLVGTDRARTLLNGASDRFSRSGLQSCLPPEIEGHATFLNTESVSNEVE